MLSFKDVPFLVQLIKCAIWRTSAKYDFHLSRVLGHYMTYLNIQNMFASECCPTPTLVRVLHP